MFFVKIHSVDISECHAITITKKILKTSKMKCFSLFIQFGVF